MNLIPFMDKITEYVLYCTTEVCCNEIGCTTDNVELANLHFNKKGWTVTETDVLCPDCAKKV
jgi:hypothetical protein